MHAPATSFRFVASLLSLSLAFASAAARAAVTPQRLRCEYLENPIGLDVPKPRLSWIVTSSERAARQAAYQIVVAGSEVEAAAGRGDLWDSGKFGSDETNAIVYGGKPIGSGQRAWWSLRTWDAKDQPSGWSPPAFWETGLLAAGDWHGQWIARAPSSSQTLGRDNPMPMLRRAFPLDGKIKRARVYLVGLGYFELTINGQRISDRLLEPAFTRYDRRVLYVTHDVTAALRGGENVLGVLLGNGWFNVPTKAAWDFDLAPWRATPRLLLELRVDLDDGRTITIASDEKWKTADSPITFASIYGGENYDARREQRGWNAPGFDDRAWQPAVVVDAPKGRLVAEAMHPVRSSEAITPVAVTEPAPGVYVFDAGQNLTGKAAVAIDGPAGTTIAMRYGEKLGADGRVDQAKIGEHVLRFDPTQQFQTDRYTLRGERGEGWHSRFTYHGFRYVELTGAPVKPTAENLRVRVMHADVPAVGAFETSNPVVNRIWTNGRWSYLSNLFAFPTDCPHREKNGWTGDAHIACEQGLFYQDGITVYEKWLNDLSDEQFITGALPGIVPTSGQWGYGFGSGPSWDSALLMIPWCLYEYYGDSTALRTHYEKMKKYVDYLTTRAKDGIVGIGLGDWSPWKTKAPREVTDTAIYYRDAQIVAAVARMLKKDADVKKYDALVERTRRDFNQKFFHAENAGYADNSQTALATALFYGLAEPAAAPRVADQLVAAIAKTDQHLDFGFLGSKYVPNALAAYGRADLAYTIIMQPTQPSYAAQIAAGATTLWENWEGEQSQNHTFFGDVNAWFMKHIAGIRADSSAPGFRKIIIEPELLGDLTWAKGSYDSVRGLIRSEWKRDGDRFELAVTIPANCRASVGLPTKDASSIREQGRALGGDPAIKPLGLRGNRTWVEIGSGQYMFTVGP